MGGPNVVTKVLIRARGGRREPGRLCVRGGGGRLGVAARLSLKAGRGQGVQASLEPRRREPGSPQPPACRHLLDWLTGPWGSSSCCSQPLGWRSLVRVAAAQRPKGCRRLPGPRGGQAEPGLELDHARSLNSACVPHLETQRVSHSLCKVPKGSAQRFVSFLPDLPPSPQFLKPEAKATALVILTSVCGTSWMWPCPQAAPGGRDSWTGKVATLQDRAGGAQDPVRAAARHRLLWAALTSSPRCPAGSHP